MHPARIAELLVPFLGGPAAGTAGQALEALSTAQLQRISTYVDILIRWNARINLTAIRDEEDIVTRHFGESLFAARHLFPSATHVVTGAPPVEAKRSEGIPHRPKAGPGSTAELATDALPDARSLTPKARLTVADLGSGAGFPGLPIKIWAPQISLTLIESNHKKAAFLSEVTRALTLTNVDIQNARAESLPPSSYSLVTLRAVERFESILPTAAALVVPAGRLALLIGSAQQSQAQASLPNLIWSKPAGVPNSRSRILLIANSRPVIR
jgi:16S rRNA (guanine527-N7)-methyltransferase